MSVYVSIKGVDRIRGTLNNARLISILDKTLQESAAAGRDMTKKLPAVSAATTGYDARGIPVASGRTRQSIHSKKLSLLAAGIFANTRYSKHVHDGTSKMPERPFFKWMLELGGMDRIEFIVQRNLSKFFRGK